MEAVKTVVEDLANLNVGDVFRFNDFGGKYRYLGYGSTDLAIGFGYKYESIKTGTVYAKKYSRLVLINKP